MHNYAFIDYTHKATSKLKETILKCLKKFTYTLF